MPEVHFTNLLIVAAVAFAAPLTLGLAPALRLPAVVLEIVAGIVIGPSGLGWVEVDPPVDILAVLGLAFLLFLAGLEVDPARLRGRTLRVTSIGFVLSFAIGISAGLLLHAGGFVKSPLLIAIILLILFSSLQASTSTTTKLVLLGGFAVLVALLAWRCEERDTPRASAPFW